MEKNMKIRRGKQNSMHAVDVVNLTRKLKRANNKESTKWYGANCKKPLTSLEVKGDMEVRQ